MTIYKCDLCGKTVKSIHNDDLFRMDFCSDCGSKYLSDMRKEYEINLEPFRKKEILRIVELYKNLQVKEEVENAIY
jgi:DNA-directed RNA polymerase subunit RPC12/RpoP